MGNLKNLFSRKCRYEKCLSIGMLPYLVDSCKRVHECETSPGSTSTNSPLIDVAMVKYEPFNTTVIKENLSDIFYTVYNNSSISKDLYLLGIQYLQIFPITYFSCFRQLCFSTNCGEEK